MNLKKIIRKTLRSIPFLERVRDDIETRKILKNRARIYPEFQWKKGARGPIKRVEATRIQVGSKLYVFGGYVTLAHVTSRIDVYDMATNRWEYLGDMPDDVSQTHNGAVYDGNSHIYFVGGQIGNLCSPATTNCHAFNISDRSWKRIPSLPQARYMPLVVLHKNRIHCLSGTLPDRSSGAHEHWSIGIHDGDATEAEWRLDGSLEKARTHTACCVMGDEIFIFGGQQGDLPPIEGDPLYRCDFNSPMERLFDECYAYHLESGMIRLLASLPEKISHTEHAIIQVGSNILIPGGIFDRRSMCDLIFCYHLDEDAWKIIGRLPLPMKSKVVGLWKNRIYLVCGQRSVDETDIRPGKVLDTVWYADLPKSLQ